MSFCFKTVLPLILLQNSKFAYHFASKLFCPLVCFKTLSLRVILLQNCFALILLQNSKFACHFASKLFYPLVCFKTLNLRVILLQNCMPVSFYFWGCLQFVARRRCLRFRRMERHSRINSANGNAYLWGASVSNSLRASGACSLGAWNASRA